MILTYLTSLIVFFSMHLSPQQPSTTDVDICVSADEVKLYEIINDYRKKKKLDQIKIVSKTGSRKKTQNGKITFNSFRKGNVVGDHKAIFSSKDEVIELSHEALDRGIFATGAIQAAKWGINKKAGLYSMIDVLEK